MDGKQISPKEEQIFVEEMVNSPQLYEYMRDTADEYGLFVFIPYMFGTTYYGMQVCPEKSVLIPCFHDEAYVYMRLFRQAYVKARGMIYNAMPEMELANRVYDFTTTEQICMGIGMDTRIQSDAETFRKQYHIDKPFLLYAGRKDVGKKRPHFAAVLCRMETAAEGRPSAGADRRRRYCHSGIGERRCL